MGETKPHTPIPFLGGHHFRQRVISFRRTVFTPIIVQKQRKPTDGYKRQKTASCSKPEPLAVLYFQSLNMSSNAISNAVRILF